MTNADMESVVQSDVDVLERAADCFTNVRRNLLQGAAFLYLISSQNLWRGAYSSFGEYVQKHCQISESFAAKLVKIHEYYVVTGNVDPQYLNGVDSEKLYLAMRLSGTPQEQAQCAMAWSRTEIKAQLYDNAHEDCTHSATEDYHRCLGCNKFFKKA